MTGRAYLLPAAIAAAVGLPYVASDDQGAASSRGARRPASMTSSASTPSGLANSYYPNSINGSIPWQSGVPFPQTGGGPANTAGAGGFSAAGPIVAAGPWTPTMHSAATAPGVVYGRPAPTRTGFYGGTLQAVNPSIPTATLFRFDITPQWIIHTWPQVSSDVTDPPLAGMRTAIVTGTGIQDIAGSMTYYFDSRQQLQRINFHGTTGDPTPLVRLLASHYQMSSEPALNGSVYVAREKDLVKSMLAVRLAPLVRQSQPHRRYQLDVELNRPGGSTALSDRLTAMLEAERKLLSQTDSPPTEPATR